MTQYEYLVYEPDDDHAIVTVTLNRPRQRNAQSRGLLVELNDALLAAEADDRVRVIVLRGAGPMFSSGHDLGSSDAVREREPGPDQHVSYHTNGGTRLASEKRMLQEWHYFFENTKRWRNLRKITVAEVHGPVYAAGLMLAWACDLIVAAEDTTFADVVGTRLGMCGVEYFAHPWELGPRRAKELLLTGDAMDVEEAHRIGMVSKVFPSDRVHESTLAFARRLAAVPSMSALLIKESVNQAVDIMGFQSALSAGFNIHSLNHAYWERVNDDGVAVGRPNAGTAPGPAVVRERDAAGGPAS